MSYVRELLDCAPAATILGAAHVATAVDACLAASQASTSCADLCLAEDDVAALRDCIALSQNCADVCDTTARVLSRPTRSEKNVLVHHMLRACVRACTSCAEECARHAADHRHCAICATACRACEHGCTALLEAEAFVDLQKLAGA